MKVLSFTNLYPNAVRPNFGVFVRERLRRLRTTAGWKHRVIAPVPYFPRLPGFGRWSEQARVPRQELDDGVPVIHPRYFKFPGVGLDGQAKAMAKGVQKTFARLVSEERPDVIDAHYLYPDCVAASLLAAEHGIPFLASARGSDVNVILRREGPRDQVLEMIHRASFVCGVSKALCRKMTELSPEDSERIVHAPNGVDLDRFAPGPQKAARRELGQTEEGTLLLFVGNLIRTKGVHELVESFSKLEGDARLVLIGRGGERGPLQARAEQLGVQQRVHFAGEVVHDSLPTWYRAADRFVFPTYSEGHPNVLCEALACGLPVVASAVGGVPEIVNPKVGEVFDVDAGEVSSGLGERFLKALQQSLSRSYEPNDLLEVRRSLGWEPTLATLRSLFDRAVHGTAGSSAEVSP